MTAGAQRAPRRRDWGRGGSTGGATGRLLRACRRVDSRAVGLARLDAALSAPCRPRVRRRLWSLSFFFFLVTPTLANHSSWRSHSCVGRPWVAAAPQRSARRVYVHFPPPPATDVTVLSTVSAFVLAGRHPISRQPHWLQRWVWHPRGSVAPPLLCPPRHRYRPAQCHKHRVRAALHPRGRHHRPCSGKAASPRPHPSPPRPTLPTKQARAEGGEKLHPPPRPPRRPTGEEMRGPPSTTRSTRPRPCRRRWQQRRAAATAAGTRWSGSARRERC